MSTLHETIYTFNGLTIKMLTKFFSDLKKKMTKFIWKHRRPQIAEAFLKKQTTKHAYTYNQYFTNKLKLATD